MSKLSLPCVALVVCVTAASVAAEHEAISVRSVGQTLDAQARAYVITSGMGGTAEGDRFEQLANTIKSARPQANVYLVNWNKDAKSSPWPWVVAKTIPRVASESARLLHDLHIDPQQLTMIGESFGNNVNLRIASHLGGVARMLALNPANELGGGGRLDLTEYCEQAWTFHSHSPYDTHQPIGHRGVLLHTPRGFTPTAQHIYGAKWLCKTIQNGDCDWLLLDKEIPTAPEGLFDLAVFVEGELDWELVPRRGHAQTIDGIANSDSPFPEASVK